MIIIVIILIILIIMTSLLLLRVSGFISLCAASGLCKPFLPSAFKQASLVEGVVVI